MTARFGSGCSGIESASVAWHTLGWSASWFAEIEPAPSAVLDHHWPHIINHGDMTKLSGKVAADQIDAPDVLVGGTPCQAFSVAGARKGLEDKRGQLTIEYVRLADAIDAKRIENSEEPCVVVWENVPGVLSSKDNAFGAFLGLLAGEDCELEPPGGKWANSGCVFGPQRAIAWRILDAQYFGVAQRRRRVFVVASARDGFDPLAVLFEFDGLRRDTAPSRSQRADTPSETEGSTGSRGSWWDGGQLSQTLDAVLHKGQMMPEKQRFPVVLTPRNSVVFGIPGNWIGRAPENGGNATEPMYDVAPCQTRTDRHAVAIAHVEVMPTMVSGGNTAASHGQLSGQFTENYIAPTSDLQVRRLTPTECERLQGFPDGHTDVLFRGKPMADSPRYKALGNSKAVPVVRWIGRRIDQQIGKPVIESLIEALNRNLAERIKLCL